MTCRPADVLRPAIVMEWCGAPGATPNGNERPAALEMCWEYECCRPTGHISSVASVLMYTIGARAHTVMQPKDTSDTRHRTDL